MESIAPDSASASIWREKIVETGKKVINLIIWLFSVITTKIKDAGFAVVAAIRTIEVDALKDSLGLFHDWFSWFVASIIALKFTDTGKAFSANYSVLKAMVLIRFISFLITLSAMLSQMHKRNTYPLLLMLLFESVASTLAVSLFSLSALWISVTLWLCIFLLLGCRYQKLKELVENQNQEGPPLPIVSRPPLLNNQ